MPSGIFAGSDGLITSFLGLGPSESIRHKRVAMELSRHRPDGLDFGNMVSRIYEQICENRTARQPSEQNWRLERQLEIARENTSAEVVLERAIARVSHWGMLDGWYNQVPVASGLVDTHSDRRAAVDLVRHRQNHATLVELKCTSDNPLYAAFEILRYGLAYLFAYSHRSQLGYGRKQLLDVEHVALWVLAPLPYFDPYHLGWLAAGLSEAIGETARRVTFGALSMDLSVRAFPESFDWPVTSGKEVMEMRRGDPIAQAMIAGVQEIQGLWGDSDDG